ncbi:MAG TPA: 50S ribosomal protein L29 [Anaerolinea sp.]|nr:50S ribosomal protein L29 [Anaerolinea sp.]
MKPAELRLLSTEEIQSKLDEARHELMNLRFQAVSGQLTDTSRLKQSRRLIAQYMTVLRERELAGKEGA